MELILSRHGNTFGPTDPVVWAGSSHDVPLVEEGIAQAHRFADSLIANSISPAAIYCGPLQRTVSYATIILERLKLPFGFKTDSRLNEIDYGKWSGLTSKEIIDRYGPEELEAWDKKCRWPQHAEWGGSESNVVIEVRSFVEDMVSLYSETSAIIIVTSNGRLRYFLPIVEGELQKRIENESFKVKTGNICKLHYQNQMFTIPYWNSRPSPNSTI